MKTPLVSIITPCYNSESYLPRYLESILNQTYDNIELILVNDGSKDGTEQLILSYEKKIKDRGFVLKYINQENQGIGGAINNGLKYIQGDFFAWCDSDNFYSSDYVKSKVDFFSKNPQYSIVRCDGYIVYDSNITTPIAKMSNGNSDVYQEKLFENCIDERNFHFGCAMLRTKDFDLINPSREIYPSREGQNWQLLLPMFYNFRSGYIDKPMFYFVFRQDSVSNVTQIQSVDRLINQKNEYEKILIETIVSMKISEEATYISRVRIKYSKIRFRIYVEHKMKLQAKTEYMFLKKNGALNLKTRMLYLKTKNKFFDSIVSFLVKVKRSLRK